MKDKIKGNKLLWLLLLFLLIFLLYRFFSPPVVSRTSSDPANPQPTISEQIIKCQNIVVSPRVTTELYTYVSGPKVRADYRIGAITNEDSFKTQIYFDGQWIYLWNPAMRFNNTDPVNNPPGIKIKSSQFDYKIETAELDKVNRFKDGQVSGDRLCTVWDDVDQPFSLPSDIEFIESSELSAKLKGELDRICRICDPINIDTVKSICRQNLSCQ